MAPAAASPAPLSTATMPGASWVATPSATVAVPDSSALDPANSSWAPALAAKTPGASWFFTPSAMVAAPAFSSVPPAAN
ncbi:hypothetical protein AOC05_09570 [Arthrobacter alpinus]|uniref:Uncharacterized protein n=1 Tax=Arthrobacter alpinus TaxID=656366 RepID=A0A0M4QFY7_9MICC|nr:hypothetical protein AOC05_09570 [Arthrobacter alpinus]